MIWFGEIRLTGKCGTLSSEIYAGGLSPDLFKAERMINRFGSELI
jgi:hypothetical protein